MRHSILRSYSAHAIVEPSGDQERSWTAASSYFASTRGSPPASVSNSQNVTGMSPLAEVMGWPVNTTLVPPGSHA